MLRSSIARAAVVLPMLAFLGACASPVTLIERAVEARSSEDIIVDNKIVTDVNRIMANLGTVKASTEIYEQRLLITGLFDNKRLYDRFKQRVERLRRVKTLYWHVTYMSEEDQERNADRLLDWADVLELDTRAGARLVGTRGVADVNYKVVADAFGAVYLLGRARSSGEESLALRRARGTEGARSVVDYVNVRP